jgi:hypothetical protein
VLLVAGTLLPAAQPGASIFVGTNPVRPTLAVDAGGTAVVTWLEHGTLRASGPARGQLFHAGSLSGDVSRPAGKAGLANALVARRTPDGRMWALQAWPETPGGPIELHLARWKGAPTKLTLAYDRTKLTGRAEFQGKPATGTSPTLEGKQLRTYVYLDCAGCPGSGAG